MKSANKKGGVNSLLKGFAGKAQSVAKKANSTGKTLPYTKDNTKRPETEEGNKAKY